MCQARLVSVLLRIKHCQSKSKAYYCAQGKLSPGLRILESGAVSLLREIEGEASELLHTVSAQLSECVVLDELGILVTQIQPHVIMARTNCTVWTLPHAAFRRAVSHPTANQGLTVTSDPQGLVSKKSHELQRELSVPLMPTVSEANALIGFPVLLRNLLSSAHKPSSCMQPQVNV
jgi:CRP-like cAMP-binding protein